MKFRLIKLLALVACSLWLAALPTLAASTSSKAKPKTGSSSAKSKTTTTSSKKAAQPKPPAPARDDEPETPGKASPFAAEDPSILPEVRGEAILVCDASTGRVLFERNADQLRPVASTQKLLTALIVAESGNLSDDVVVEASDTDCEPTKLYMKPGEKYERYKLLQVLLVKSMNDVARCLARDNAGSLEAFADKMNAKAREIGMKNSRFMNPNGLPAAGQYSNARDMARLALHVYRNRVLRGIVSLRTLTWVSPTGRPTVYENTNRVLKYFGLCNGMKTGYTNAAGHCLVTSASDGGRHVVCVILGSTKGIIATDSYRLLSWGLYQLGASPAAVSARN